MADAKRKWRVQFKIIGDILFREPFSICRIDFQMVSDREFVALFVALMDLNVAPENFQKADEVAYEKLMNIFTISTLIHKGVLAIEKNSLMALPIKENNITYEIDERGNKITVKNVSADIRMGFRCEMQLCKKVMMSADKILRIEKILKLSEINESAGLILTLLRIDNPYSSFNLFRIFELMRKDYGGKEKIKELTPKTQGFSISDFTNSLDKPYGVGITHSRHSVSSGDIGKVMSIDQCRVFLFELLDNWIDARISDLEEMDA